MAVIAEYSGSLLQDWMSAFAILLGFLYSQTAFDLSEGGSTERSEVLALKLKALHVSKEAAWITTFLYLGSYPLVVGALVFMLYPTLRKSLRAGTKHTT